MKIGYQVIVSGKSFRPFTNRDEAYRAARRFGGIVRLVCLPS